MTSTAEQCLKSVMQRLGGIKKAIEANEVPQCLAEVERAVADLEYAMRLLPKSARETIE